jgi:signal transduction histidine kinase
MVRKKIFIHLLILYTLTSFSQKKSSVFILNDSIEYHIKYRNKIKAKEFIDKMSSYEFKNFNEKYLLDKNKYYYHFILKQNDSCLIVLNNINKYKEELNIYNLTNYYTNLAYLNKTISQLDLSINYFIKALSTIENISENHSQKISIYAGLSSLYSQINNPKKELFYIQAYLKESYNGVDKNRIGYALNNLAVYYDKKNEPEKAILNFRKALNNMNRIETRNAIYQNIGAIHLNYYSNIDSARYFYKKATNRATSKRIFAFIHKDLSVIAKRNQDFKLENIELLKALKNIKLDKFPEFELKLYKKLSENNKNLKSYKKSLFYLEKYDSLNNVIKNKSLIETVEEIETKYQSEKKDKEIVLQKQKILTEQQEKKYLIFGVSLFVVFGGTIGFLTLKNSRKKQLLAEQQKELETQKNLTLLKEQELTTINAMIDGQEKERVRIAEDLHDNLGSVLATLKLHFENLKFNKDQKKLDQETLFNKTESLIDEAYLKVRRIAHAKNAGVIASQGLLTSIQMMAEKISSADNISIEVVHFGLDKRLENSLEIGVFRIIQELITNTIKHANASNATINLSLYDNTLTIIVEDNGKGFDMEKTNLTKSMGLNSIQTRITHLKGTLEIDSTIDKGTSIILQIPIT